MKVCKRCKSSLPFSEFYKHNETSDGRLSFCKSCVKERVRSHREKNIDKIRENDKKRNMLKHRVEARKRYLNSDVGRLVAKRAKKKWKYNNPKTRKAHSAVANAKRSGKLIEMPCEVCGTNKNIHAHHCDYNKPLDVMWLCDEHHKLWHEHYEPIL